MKYIRTLALSGLVPATLLAIPLSAQALSFTFTGVVPTGSDPLGGVYTAGPFGGGLVNFEEVAGGQPDPTQQVLFDPSAAGLKDATSFTLTETGAKDKIIAKDLGFGLFFETFTPDGDIVSDWKISEDDGKQSITFTAPKAKDELVAGDRFAVDVTFSQADSLPPGFGFDITWSGDAAVPEPSSWALMIVGAGMLGGALRRRKALGLVTA